MPNSPARSIPRAAEVPFDSAYKFMGDLPRAAARRRRRSSSLLVKGGPDVVLERCSTVVDARRARCPSRTRATAILDANRKLSEQGLRVLAFAVRRFAPGAAVPADPMAEVKDLTLVGLVGIIDPLRPSSKEAVRIAHAGRHRRAHDHGRPRDHGCRDRREARPRPGCASGADIQAMTDDELKAALPNLHVFGRVTPEDKLRLARLMQENGDVVAMTGDAVNDAAALKQADIGVAMGSGSEVTKQAGKMILVDDNFGTLVTAVKLGRAIYDKIVSYVRYQMSQLFSLVLLFLVASIFDINNGVPLTPIMILFLNFFISIFPVIVILLDPVSRRHHAEAAARPEEDDRQRRGRDLWFIYGGAAVPHDPDPAADLPRPAELDRTQRARDDDVRGRRLRRDPRRTRDATRPRVRSHGADSRGSEVARRSPSALTVAAVEIGFLQKLVGTMSLSGNEWLICIGLALVVPSSSRSRSGSARRRIARARDS